MSARTVGSALSRLAEGEALLVHDFATSTAALAETADASSDLDRGGPLEGQLDEVMASAAVLAAYGSEHLGVRGLLVGLETLAQTKSGYDRDVNDGVLGRAVYGIAVVALSFRRPHVLASMNAAPRLKDHGVSGNFFSDPDLRYEVGVDGSVEAYPRVDDWFRRAGWRKELGPLADRETATAALAEVELLACCVSVGEEGRVETSAVKRSREAGRRIVARLRAPDQRPAMRSIFAVDEDGDLDAAVAERFARLTDGRPGSLHLSLFD